MDVRTILWPSDLSRNSLKASRHVVSLADKYQARVILLYVGVDPLSLFPAWGNVPSDKMLEHFKDHEVKVAKEKMAAICEKDLKACPRLEVKLVQGDAAAEILKMAGQEQADLIVITTHGRGHDEIDQMTPGFGSVAEKVIRNSPVPVHLVNPFRE
jgi:nucleotide-binding universal stress UspA family protein